MKKHYFLILVSFVFFSNLSAQLPIKINKFLEGAIVNGIAKNSSDVWFATEGNGIYRYTPATDEWDHYSTSEENIPYDFFFCIEANDDFVWAGSTDGLFIYDIKRNQWNRRKFGVGGQLSNWIRGITYDKYDDVVWIGRFMYLTKYDVKSRKYTDYDLTVDNVAKTNSIKTIGVENSKIVWFGTEAGLHKYNKTIDMNIDGALTFYDNRLNYFNGRGEEVSVSKILIERDYVWIGLDEFITPDRPEFNLGGLFRYDKKNQWLRFDTQTGLRANGISAIERTGNYIWAALYQFGKDTKEQFGRGVAIINRDTEKVLTISEEYLPANIISLCYGDGYMWAGSKSGVYKIEITNSLAEWSLNK